MGLLILEREIGEWVHVGEDINVLLHDVRGQRAWLGFDAPRSIPIYRDDAKQVERQPRFILSEEQCLQLKAACHPSFEINTPDDLCAVLIGEAKRYPE